MEMISCCRLIGTVIHNSTYKSPVGSLKIFSKKFIKFTEPIILKKIVSHVEATVHCKFMFSEYLEREALGSSLILVIIPGNWYVYESGN